MQADENNAGKIIDQTEGVNKLVIFITSAEGQAENDNAGGAEHQRPGHPLLRKLGFGLEALDISEYAHLDGRYDEQPAFYMKRRL